MRVCDFGVLRCTLRSCLGESLSPELSPSEAKRPSPFLLHPKHPSFTLRPCDARFVFWPGDCWCWKGSTGQLRFCNNMTHAYRRVPSPSPLLEHLLLVWRDSHVFPMACVACEVLRSFPAGGFGSQYQRFIQMTILFFNQVLQLSSLYQGLDTKKFFQITGIKILKNKHTLGGQRNSTENKALAIYIHDRFGFDLQNHICSACTQTGMISKYSYVWPQKTQKKTIFIK